MNCEVCGSFNDLQTHHDSYDPPITRVLCVKCHYEIHKHGVGAPLGQPHGKVPIKMNIDRDVDQGGTHVTLKRVSFCLNQLEKYGFKKGLEWRTEVNRNLYLEEMVGALVASEQVLRDLELIAWRRGEED